MAVKRPSKLDRQAEAVMDAARVLIAITAHSLAETEVAVTLPQLRVLVMIYRNGPLNLSTVAHGLGVHPSNATRTCQRLVQMDLVNRQDADHDRRNVLLTLSPKAERLVESLLQQRRDAIKRVLREMPSDRRDLLKEVLEEFAHAAGDTPDELAAALGWTR